MGNQAYKWLLTGENEIRQCGHSRKSRSLSSKSVIVPAMNFTSNLLHDDPWCAVGTIARLLPKKLAEVPDYTKTSRARLS